MLRHTLKIQVETHLQKKQEDLEATIKELLGPWCTEVKTLDGSLLPTWRCPRLQMLPWRRQKQSPVSLNLQVSLK
jgi:hypothetical protein